MLGGDHRPYPVADKDGMPEDGMIACAKGHRLRRTDTSAEPEMQDNNEKKSRQERDSRPRRRQAALKKRDWSGSGDHAAGFPSSVSVGAVDTVG